MAVIAKDLIAAAKVTALKASNSVLTQPGHQRLDHRLLNKSHDLAGFPGTDARQTLPRLVASVLHLLPVGIPGGLDCRHR